MEKVGKIINSRHLRGLNFSIMPSVSILAITLSFMLRIG